MAYVNQIIDVRVLDCVRLVILQSIEGHPDIGVVVVRPVGEDQPFLSGVDAEVRHRNAILVVEQKVETSALASLKGGKKEPGLLLVQNRKGQAGGQVGAGLFKQAGVGFTRK